MTSDVDLSSGLQAWIRRADLDMIQGSQTDDGRTIIWNKGGEVRYFINLVDGWCLVTSSDRMGPENFNFAGASMPVTEKYLYQAIGGSVRRDDLPSIRVPFERHELRAGYTIGKQLFAGRERKTLINGAGDILAIAAIDQLITLSHCLDAPVEAIKSSFEAADGKPLFSAWKDLDA
ncbi:Imm61 family immunity protein [Mycobacterium sp. M23085]|uniref:Imm61 family immunity protein n=1 Tax=Mycobacterium sp. M23085 TaxID=3378087 RepID=UPI0038783435